MNPPCLPAGPSLPPSPFTPFASELQEGACVCCIKFLLLCCCSSSPFWLWAVLKPNWARFLVDQLLNIVVSLGFYFLPSCQHAKTLKVCFASAHSALPVPSSLLPLLPSQPGLSAYLLVSFGHWSKPVFGFHSWGPLASPLPAVCLQHRPFRGHALLPSFLLKHFTSTLGISIGKKTSRSALPPRSHHRGGGPFHRLPSE
jgi:hypothetical protein